MSEQSIARSKPTALITGASSGIGLEFARILAAEGHDLVLVARSQGKLDELASELSKAHGTIVRVAAIDLSKPDSPKEVFSFCQEHGLSIDVLINNAGYGLFGAFAETELPTELAMLQLNVVALTELTKRFLPAMLARKSGKILNVASTAAFQPGPLMAVYYATKAYVLSFSEAIAKELEGSGVVVSALCPGPTASGFAAQANLESSKLVAGKKLPDSESVARAGWEGIKREQTVVIPGAQNWLLANAVRFLPRNTVAGMVLRAQEKAH
jgi:uncharacterized protein